MKKSILGIILTTTLTLTGIFMTVSESANASTLLNNDHEKTIMNYGFSSDDELEQFFLENDVSIEKQIILKEKIENNEPWDCYKDGAENLLPKDFSYFDINDTETNKRFTFEDGSFIEINIEPSKNSREIVSDSYGTRYTNHKISRQVGGTKAWFYANFYVARYGPSSFWTEAEGYNAPYGEGISGFGATGNPTKTMIRKSENTSTKQAALFELRWFNQITVDGSWAGIGGSAPIGSTCTLYLALVNNKMYVDSSLPF
ncbi:hypothetical protein [Clostridium sp.]|uniref:hypothetical protein n=1 Tax=Clostridium sp. TaxID=1506 RepID=UPI003F30DA0F